MNLPHVRSDSLLCQQSACHTGEVRSSRNVRCAGEPAGVWVEEPDSSAVGLIAGEDALDAVLMRLNRRA